MNIVSKGSIGVSILITILKFSLDGLEDDLKNGKIYQDLTKEISDLFISLLKSNFSVALDHIKENSIQKAQEALNQAIELAKTHLTPKKINEWVGKLDPLQGLKLMITIFQISRSLCETYLEIYQGDFYEKHKNRANILLKTLFNSVCNSRLRLIECSCPDIQNKQNYYLDES